MSSDIEAGPRRPAEPPTGRQLHLVHGDQEVVVTEVGATLRSYRVAGRAVVDGFTEEERSTDGRGQMLIPWPGRVGDGRYRLDGEEHQLPVDELPRGNAIHGLVHWANWTVAEHTDSRLEMRHRLHAQDGYPFCLDLEVTFALDGAGLSVTVTATNVGTGRAPLGTGAHPYLTVGTPVIDACRLTIPAPTMLTTDARMLPVARAAVEGTDLDFRAPRRIGKTVLDTAYTDLERDADGLARVCLESPDGRRVCLWLDAAERWVVVFSGDTLASQERRRGLAVEPMTCAPDAFRSGEDLIVLAPGDSATSSWGIDVTGLR